jgi:hypothetical protein
MSCGIGLVPRGLGCFERASLAPPCSPASCLTMCVFCHRGIHQKALTRGRTDEAAQSWTFNLQNCELNEPLFLVKYSALVIVL